MTAPFSCLWPEPGVTPLDTAEVCRELTRRDPPLGRVIERAGACAIPANTSMGAFETLAHSIVHQQLSGKAARTIFDRFRGLYPPGAFPAPDLVLQTRHRKLRGVGLSEAKAKAIRDLAEHGRAGAIPSVEVLRGMTPDEIVERLTVVRGVGRWTVEMLLIFRLGHPDVLPAQDLGIRKGLARIMRRRELPEPDAVMKRGERWRPWRSVASWYLWRAADQPPVRARSRRP